MNIVAANANYIRVAVTIESIPIKGMLLGKRGTKQSYVGTPSEDRNVGYVTLFVEMSSNIEDHIG